MSREPDLTGNLYAMPSFLAGVARLFDFWGLFTRYDTAPNERVADSRALLADWCAVGQDIRLATEPYSRESP